MCGIIGCVGHETDTLAVLLEGLDTLEYRGYDSAGVALADTDLTVVKRAGELDVLRNTIDKQALPATSNAGIGHTRWSTHGPPTDANAHPHTDESGTVAVVHNGIIENYDDLRTELERQGVTFTSDTDTEVIPHLIAAYLDAGEDLETSFRRTLDRLEGSFAVSAVVAGDDRIFGARRDSPLVLGIGDGTYYLASDVPAFLEQTQDVVYLDDGEIAVISPDGWDVSTSDGIPCQKEVSTVSWEAEQTGKGGYEHFMLKEIHEQPTALRQGLSGRLDELTGTVTVDALEDVSVPGSVQFIACGTSYHAALYGVELFREAGIPAQAFLASEYATGPPPLPDDGLVIGVTQSGETADTLAALREAQARGAETLALTNVVGSTAARECDHVMYIRSGPEIGVAATKTFTSQLTSLNLLVEALSHDCPASTTHTLIDALRDLPGQIQEIIEETDAGAVIEEYVDGDAFFFIGRGLNYPVALEGALKFKEISYEHAEGFAAGELKHGPLALVTSETPVFATVTGTDDRARKTIGNIKEIEARGAPVIAVTDGATEVHQYSDATLTIPSAHPRTAPILASVQLQLVAYHMADRLGRSIDKPRNLAKSVTVE